MKVPLGLRRLLLGSIRVLLEFGSLSVLQGLHVKKKVQEANLVR